MLLEVEDLRKEFPGVLALDGVSLRLQAGTVHAVMGENGAGKSTLMKIIAGIHPPDAGTVRLRGRPVQLGSPREALQHGIAMIHQELNLMPSMTVAENVWIGREPLTRLGFVDHGELRRRTAELFLGLGIETEPSLSVGELSVAERQMVEIAKALSRDAALLIMDEPTSAMTETETRRLFDIIRELKAQGKGILYITHRLNEVFEIADEISVLRDGRRIGTRPAPEITPEELIRWMVGRDLTQLFPRGESTVGRVVLSVRELGLEGRFRGVSFDLRVGEILGVAGLIGAGRSNLAETLFGLTPASSGTIEIEGRVVVIAHPSDAVRQGMAFLTEDRKESGCFLPLDVLSNLTLAALNRRFVRAGFVDHAEAASEGRRLAASLRLRTPGLDEPVMNLSGGNQQKVLIGRWLLTGPRILILDEPTRGIDVGAKAEIHRLIAELAREGAAVLMISSDLPEVLGMSDRIMVMHEGTVTGFLDRDEADQVRVMTLASH
ncbi:MAG TPA: sugar ABC transporter ATP-binding protein [Gemmatimonadales bacterium]